MRKRRAPETQNLLSALKARMAVKGASSEAIVQAFIKRHPEVIAKERDELIFTGLMKLVGQVGAVRLGSASAAQMEMFVDYAVPKTVLYPMPDGTNLHRQVQALTLLEGREYVLHRTRPKLRVPAELKEMVRLLDDIEPYKLSDQSTIGECWVAHREAEGG